MHSDPIRQARMVSALAVAWGGGAGAYAVWAGVGSASIALIGTGAAVIADVSSSIVLVRRFHAQLRGHPAIEERERVAEFVAALALLAVAVGVLATAVARLVASGGTDSNAGAMGAAVATALVLPTFAVFKYRIARACRSAALRLDGHISLVGGAMAGVTVADLAVTARFGYRWVDPVAAVVVSITAAGIGAESLLSSRR